MSTTMLAYCGLACNRCPAYLATQNNDDALRKQTAIEWSKMYNAEIRPEHINCDGCKSGSERLFFHCSQCGIRSCTTEKAYQTCADCGDYPCDQLSFVINAVPEARAALEMLRESIK